jgi:CheY-like chemotaxis protein
MDEHKHVVSWRKQEKTMIINRLVRLALSMVLFVAAAVRWAYFDTVSDRMDTVFLGLVLLAFLIHLIPWERLTSFKAVGIEISLEEPKVQAAISGLGLDRIENKQLKNQLSKLNDELQSARGSRVLWIDDKPHNLIGARRLLRALGIQVMSATSSTAAEHILEIDNDFDLIITDVQRLGDSHTIVGGEPIHEGVNFVVKLRQHSDPIIKTLPVIFYAAYDWNRLVDFTRPARELLPEPEISNTAIDFVPKVIKRLAQVRAMSIIYGGDKKPTSVWRQ